MSKRENRMLARVRLLFVIPSLAMGGAERVMMLLLGNLDRRRFDIRLAVYEPRFEYGRPDVPITVLKHSKGGSRLVKALNFVYRAWQLRNLIREWRPGLIVSFMAGPNITALLARALAFSRCGIAVSERGAPDVTYSSRNPTLRAPRWWGWAVRCRHRA